ncbi:MAG: anhydro-N-acetylmuramic acid kinase [Bacteroidia bacterium]|nr:anhydro-N-acetylmuramic acid kinase [Bacteroidia bacterium]
MSGTSLDGLDLALCCFWEEKGTVQFEIIQAHTFPYSAKWKAMLKRAPGLSAFEYASTNAAYGRLIAEYVKKFLGGLKNHPQAISSHGHTIFHQPKLGFSTQMGCGATIAALSGITTVCDFRSLDVANGGQGAPLVPIGDKLLFGNYHACLNIGGIANISFDKEKKRLAYDICEANMLLNFLAEKCGKSYDAGGKIAASGKNNTALLKKLNSLKFYRQNPPKSLGREWFEQNILALFENSSLSLKDQLSTATEHIADMIAGELNKQAIREVLITGGGAFNNELIKQLALKTPCRLILPTKEVINFKEALIFALLGYLRLNCKTNSLATVTGARSNTIGGSVYCGID